jgi:predicted CopG family antitoxin
MIWGCHSFEGGRLHAIFSSHGINGELETRLSVIWKVLTKKGIIGYIYSKEHGESRSIENEFNNFSDYGIVHGDIDHDNHIYIFELASLRKISNEGESIQEVVRRLINEHKSREKMDMLSASPKTKLKNEDKFTLENTGELFSQSALDEMNQRLQEDIEYVNEEHYESAVRHAKFNILKICYKFE